MDYEGWKDIKETNEGVVGRQSLKAPQKGARKLKTLTLGTRKNRDSFLMAFSFFRSLTSFHWSD